MPVRSTFQTLSRPAACLLLTASSVFAAQTPPDASLPDALTNTHWYLVDFLSMDDAQGRTKNTRPLAYTLMLGDDGRATLRLDCNRAQGNWTARSADEGSIGSFGLGPLASTRALCPDDTFGPMLTRDAPYLRGYRVDGGRLHLTLMADGGIYTWAPLQRPSFDCERADSSATELICIDAELSALDRALSARYRQVRETPGMAETRRKTLVATQRGWIKGRDDCWKAPELRQCVRDSMLMRIHELRSMAAASRDTADEGGGGFFTLDCDDNTIKASVSFVDGDPPLAYLQWNDEGSALVATPTASGVRYQGDFLGMPVSLWTHHTESMIERGASPARTCRLIDGEQ